MPLTFSSQGPFDEEEQRVIIDVVEALAHSQHPNLTALTARLTSAIAQLDRLGEVLCSYPSLQGQQSLGSRRRDRESLVDMLVRAEPSSLEMCLPTRALVSRALVMGEVNFYRSLRFICAEALPPQQVAAVMPRVERRLCHCLYTRLAELVLLNISMDGEVERMQRHRAVIALSQVWEQTTYRVSDFFPVLEATWEARRSVPATLGTLMGTAEMFRLIEAGCDDRFVDYLVREDRTADEEAAFREFLFGATTEQLKRIERMMDAQGKGAIDKDAVAQSERLRDACGQTSGSDPALALFEFFLSRHLQASARRQADTPGPRRTAEEYVMLNFLGTVATERLSAPPSR